MRRESHVRFCESAGVKLPRATHLAELVAKLNLKEAVHVGHSTGGGEVARYIGRSWNFGSLASPAGSSCRR